MAKITTLSPQHAETRAKQLDVHLRGLVVETIGRRLREAAYNDGSVELGKWAAGQALDQIADLLSDWELRHVLAVDALTSTATELRRDGRRGLPQMADLLSQMACGILPAPVQHGKAATR